MMMTHGVTIHCTNIKPHYKKKIPIDIILGEYLSGSFNIDSFISCCSGSKMLKHKIEPAKTYHYNDD